MKHKQKAQGSSPVLTAGNLMLHVSFTFCNGGQNVFILSCLNLGVGWGDGLVSSPALGALGWWKGFWAKVLRAQRGETLYLNIPECNYRGERSAFGFTASFRTQL